MTVPPGVAGVRIVVKSGERVDLRLDRPADGRDRRRRWVVGCHIPGHWARGMQVPVRWVVPTPASEGLGWYALQPAPRACVRR